MTNVTSLLKTVKAVEDEATRGTRALEATIEYIKQELTVRGLNVFYQLLQESTAEMQRGCEACSSWVRDICVYYSEQNRGAFCSFFLLIFVQLSSLLLPSQAL